MTTVEPIRDVNKIRKIEKILAKNSKRDELLFLIGINCGLRISDILNLNVEDVKNKVFIKVREQKTGKIRQIPINKKLKQNIKEYTKNLKEGEPLFTSKYHNRLERTYIYKVINNACKKAKVHGIIGTHTMRKTFGYHHYKMFKDVAMLQKIFNHSSPYITLRYIGIEQSKIDESYLKLIL